VVERVDCRALGLAVVGLGGGRRRPDDEIDYAVGLSEISELGQRVTAGQPLALVHARDSQSALLAVREVQSAYLIGTLGMALPPSVYCVID